MSNPICCDRHESLQLIEDAHYLSSVFDNLDICVFATNLSKQFVYTNQKFCDFLELDKEQVHQRTPTELNVSLDINCLFATDHEVMTGHKEIEKECVSFSLANQTHQYFQIDKKPLFDDAHELIGVLTIMSDITEKKIAEQALQSSLNVMRVLAETGENEQHNIFELIVQQLALSQGVKYALIAKVDESLPGQVKTIAVWDGDRIVENFSYDLYGTPCGIVLEDEVCYFKDNVQCLFPEDIDLVNMQARSYIGAPLRDRMGNSIGIISLLDVKPFQESKHSVELLKSLATRVSIELQQLEYNSQKKLYSEIFKSSHDALVITDKNYAVIDTNPAYSRITGFTRDEMLGEKMVLNTAADSQSVHDSRQKELLEHGYWQGEMTGRKKNGEMYIRLLNISTITNNQGEVTNYIGLFSDITEKKKQEEKLKLLAHYDPLTQLANRVLLVERFEKGVEHCHQHQEKMGLCFIDLDGFKGINDQFGHEVGDKLLITVAKRIKKLVRAEDTVSRQGGDEFAVLLRGVDSREQCESIVASIHQSLACPYKIDHTTHHVSASSGVALYPDDGVDIDTLLRLSDQAMYQAKLAGKNRFHFFKAFNTTQRALSDSRFREIQHALSNNEFELHYQPKVNMVTGAAFGVEALIRWRHPQRGLVPPLDFLPLIQGTELEIQVGNWVIESALQQMSQWLSQGFRLEVSINVSSNQMLDSEFLPSIQQYISQYKLSNPELIQLEILESAALNDIHSINKIISQCQEVLGLSVALDDFGTGYSSLAHLRRLSANTIKIDRSFVHDVLDNPSDCAIIEGILSLANAFGRQVVAEGVETFEHSLILLLMGCENVQGYGIARPMLAAEIAPWIAKYQPNQELLDLARTNLSYKSRRIKIFELVLEQWQHKFLKKVASGFDSKESWPILNRNKCACGAWLAKVKQDRLLSPESCSLLEAAHQQFHVTAENALNEYHKNQCHDVSFIEQELAPSVAKVKQILKNVN